MSQDPRAPQALPIAFVLPDLPAYRDLVHAVCRAPFVEGYEFTYGAPLYKGTPTIVEALGAVQGALEKFDVYFEHGILDEEQRVKLAQAFRVRYLSRHPGSEGSDVFAASADVLQFRFTLKDPRALDDGDAAVEAVFELPHDTGVADRLRREQGASPEHRSGRIKLFLDHVHNPRRQKLPEVRKVMVGPRAKDPIIVELETSGALPGLFVHLLEPVVREVRGRVVWLPG